MGEREITVMELLEMVFNEKQPKKIRYFGNDYTWCVFNADPECDGDYIRIAENDYNGIIHTFQEDVFGSFSLLSAITMGVRIIEEHPDMKETAKKDIWHWHMDDEGLTINKTDEDVTSEIFDWKNGYMKDADIPCWHYDKDMKPVSKDDWEGNPDDEYHPKHAKNEFTGKKFTNTFWNAKPGMSNKTVDMEDLFPDYKYAPNAKEKLEEDLKLAEELKSKHATMYKCEPTTTTATTENKKENGSN